MTKEGGPLETEILAGRREKTLKSYAKEIEAMYDGAKQKPLRLSPGWIKKQGVAGRRLEEKMAAFAKRIREADSSADAWELIKKQLRLDLQEIWGRETNFNEVVEAVITILEKLQKEGKKYFDITAIKKIDGGLCEIIFQRQRAGKFTLEQVVAEIKRRRPGLTIVWRPGVSLGWGARKRKMQLAEELDKERAKEARWAEEEAAKKETKRREAERLREEAERLDKEEAQKFKEEEAKKNVAQREAERLRKEKEKKPVTAADKKQRANILLLGRSKQGDKEASKALFTFLKLALAEAAKDDRKLEAIMRYDFQVQQILQHLLKEYRPEQGSLEQFVVNGFKLIASRLSD